MPRKAITPPFYPIIYVRGYAMTQTEIENTVATPFMGFNLGATKLRQNWQGEIQPLIFESPLVRLMKDYDYRDVYEDGRALVEADPKQVRIPSRSVVIYRYYDQGSKEIGEGDVPSIPEAAAGLGTLIERVRDIVCGTHASERAAFRVYLVAHSMGGIVVRCFLQNPDIGSPETKKLVDKVFTYATPHNGIETAGINVPPWLNVNDMSNFNRKRMAQFFALPRDSKRVNTLGGTFDPNRFFCLIGTNSEDYHVAHDMSRRLAGRVSDGLVRIENAYVDHAPRAFVYRSHSGHFGIVNSEEGYQNLVRFLFGNIRVDGRLIIKALPLPPDVARARDKGKKIRASYHIEVDVAPRGAITYDLTRRRTDECSAIFRKYDEIFNPSSANVTHARHPVLFSQFLSTKYRPSHSRGLMFSLSLRILVPKYEIEDVLWFDRHVPGTRLYDDTIRLHAVPPNNQNAAWTIEYACDSEGWGETTTAVSGEQKNGKLIFVMPLSSPKGFKADLELTAMPWNS